MQQTQKEKQQQKEPFGSDQQTAQRASNIQSNGRRLVEKWISERQRRRTRRSGWVDRRGLRRQNASQQNDSEPNRKKEKRFF